MRTVKFEKGGSIRSVTYDKENIKCMELAGWKLVEKEEVLTIAPPPTETVILSVREKHRGRPRKVEDVTTLGKYDGDSTDNH